MTFNLGSLCHDQNINMRYFSECIFFGRALKKEVQTNCLLVLSVRAKCGLAISVALFEKRWDGETSFFHFAGFNASQLRRFAEIQS